QRPGLQLPARHGWLKESSSMNDPVTQSEPAGEFKLWRLILAVLLILLGISISAQWYARNITLPRHCEDP
ncbi:hypothetical protein QQ73_12555, partial [Candidatus Endoriftia persephone str. Guaymas]|nr:hypothetical protein [Candidatus Endoriftia persephone str. Guaymas]